MHALSLTEDAPQPEAYGSASPAAHFITHLNEHSASQLSGFNKIKKMREARANTRNPRS